MFIACVHTLPILIRLGPQWGCSMVSMSAMLLLRAPLLRIMLLWKVVGRVIWTLLPCSFWTMTVFTLFYSPLSQAPFWPWYSESTLHFCQYLLAVWEGKPPLQWWVLDEWKEKEKHEDNCKEDEYVAVMMLLFLFTGEPLSWGERCRIKHLPTRKYLAIVQSEGEYKV